MNKLLPLKVLKYETAKDIYTCPVSKLGDKYILADDIYPGEINNFLAHMSKETYKIMNEKVIQLEKAKFIYPSLFDGGKQN